MKMRLFERQRKSFSSKFMKRKYLVLSAILVFGIVGIALMVYGGNIHNELVMLIGAFSLFSTFFFIPCFVILNKKIKEYKENKKGEVYRSILETHFPLYEFCDYIDYDLDEDRLLKSSLFSEDSERICGMYSVYGNEKNSSFFISELYNGRETPNSFARWYEFDLPKNFNHEVRICKKSLVGDIYTDGLIKCELESINFLDKYVVYATDPETLFDILTPQIIEYLINLEEKYNGKMIISFVNDKLYIVIKDKKQGLKFYIRKPINDVTYEKEISLIKLASEIIDGIQIGTDEEKPKAKKRKKKVKEDIEEEIDEIEEEIEEEIDEIEE